MKKKNLQKEGGASKPPEKKDENRQRLFHETLCRKPLSIKALEHFCEDFVILFPNSINGHYGSEAFKNLFLKVLDKYTIELLLEAGKNK